MKLSLIVVSSFVLFAVLPAHSWAQATEDARQTAAARALFQEGVRFSDSNDWANAADRFERALAVKNAPTIEFNLATAYEHLGRFVECVERLRHILNNDASTREVRTAAREKLELIEPRIGHLTIHVNGPLDDVSIKLDNTPFANALVGVDAPADPGHHVIIATRDSAEVARAQVDIAESGRGEASLTIVPRPAQVAQAAEANAHANGLGGLQNGNGGTDDPANRPIWKKTWFIVAVSVAGAAVVGGVIAAVAAKPADPHFVNGNTNPGMVSF